MLKSSLYHVLGNQRAEQLNSPDAPQSIDFDDSKSLPQMKYKSMSATKTRPLRLNEQKDNRMSVGCSPSSLIIAEVMKRQPVWWLQKELANKTSTKTPVWWLEQKFGDSTSSKDRKTKLAELPESSVESVEPQ